MSDSFKIRTIVVAPVAGLSGSAPAPAPSAWLTRWCPALAAGSTALDHAAGRGRNLGPLCQAGVRVLAVDRDPAALAALAALRTSRVPDLEILDADLESGPWPYGERRFDLVVCCNYLFRPRLDLLFARVAPGGHLIYETFARGNERYGRPSNPDFLLRPGELLEAAHRAGLEVRAYEHGETGHPPNAVVQRLYAVRPAVG